MKTRLASSVPLEPSVDRPLFSTRATAVSIPPTVCLDVICGHEVGAKAQLWYRESFQCLLPPGEYVQGTRP